MTEKVLLEDVVVYSDLSSRGVMKHSRYDEVIVDALVQKFPFLGEDFFIKAKSGEFYESLKQGDAYEVMVDLVPRKNHMGSSVSFQIGIYKDSASVYMGKFTFVHNLGAEKQVIPNSMRETFEKFF